MDIEIIYPALKKPLSIIEIVRKICFWIFLIAAYCCPIINICVGGKAWSIIVLWSLWFVWNTFLTRPLVENNLISQTTHLLLNSCILLVLIEVFLSSGWAEFVVPIICFGMLVILGIIFFLDISKQKQNMMPMLWVIGGSLVAIVSAFLGWSSMNWPTIVLGSTAFALLTASIVVLRLQFILELKKRFHTFT
ncbi:MAG TPA: DUF6320 domain-containing protein [Bacillota bacterium]